MNIHLFWCEQKGTGFWPILIQRNKNPRLSFIRQEMQLRWNKDFPQILSQTTSLIKLCTTLPIELVPIHSPKFWPFRALREFFHSQLSRPGITRVNPTEMDQTFLGSMPRKSTQKARCLRWFSWRFRFPAEPGCCSPLSPAQELIVLESPADSSDKHLFSSVVKSPILSSK